MSMSDSGQAAESDEQRQAQVIKALMQGICAVRYRKADNTPCPITQATDGLGAGDFLEDNIDRLLFVVKFEDNSAPLISDLVRCWFREWKMGLYLGSVGAAFNKEALKSLNITHILIVARSLDPVFPSEFNYKKIEVLDSPDTDLLKHSDECFSFIDEAVSSGGNCLVHCFAGRSRSVTIVVAYLMKKYQMSLESALSLVRSKRPQVAPNEGFISQLEKFQKSLQVEQERRMQSVQN